MYAQSLLVSVRAIEQSLDTVLASHRVGDAAATDTQAMSIRSTLRDVAEQLRSVTPSPGWQANGQAEADAAVRTVLDRIYVGEPEVDAVEQAVTEDNPSVASLVSSGRVHDVAGIVVVPLVGPAGDDNWRVLVDVLRDRLETVLEKTRTVEARLRADGLGDGSHLLDRWQAIDDRIDALVELLARVGTHASYVRRKAADRSARVRRLVTEIETVLYQ